MNSALRGVAASPPIQFWPWRSSPPRDSSPGPLEEDPMDLEDVVLPQRFVLPGDRERPLERPDVVEDALSGEVVRPGSKRGLRQAPVREDQSLDARRRHRLGSQQLVSQVLEIGGSRRVYVELPAGRFGVGGGGRDVGFEREALCRDECRDVGQSGHVQG